MPALAFPPLDAEALDAAIASLSEHELAEAADSMRKASTPEPFSKSKTSNWVARSGGLPAYIQHIAHDIAEKRGKPVSQAIQIAIGVVKRWARGGGNVDPGTRAAAQKAVAEWEGLKAKNAAKKLKEAKADKPESAADKPDAAAAGDGSSGPLQAGQRHERVAHLQNRLISLGAPMNADGTFGPKTHQAVTSYQEANGLKPDGVVGPKTTEALKAGGKVAPDEEGAGDQVGSADKDDAGAAGDGKRKGGGGRKITVHITESEFHPTAEVPIHDLVHAREALERCAGALEEAEVKAAVYGRYPTLRPDRASRLEEGLLKRGSSRGPTEVKRLPDGTFAPAGRGVVLKQGDKVKLPDGRTGTFHKGKYEAGSISPDDGSGIVNALDRHRRGTRLQEAARGGSRKLVLRSEDGKFAAKGTGRVLKPGDKIKATGHMTPRHTVGHPEPHSGRLLKGTLTVKKNEGGLLHVQHDANGSEHVLTAPEVHNGAGPGHQFEVDTPTPGDKPDTGAGSASSGADLWERHQTTQFGRSNFVTKAITSEKDADALAAWLNATRKGKYTKSKLNTGNWAIRGAA